MRFLKVLFWMLLGGLVAGFVIYNGDERVNVHLWSGLIADFSLPLLLILVFLAGLLPVLLAYHALRWRMLHERYDHLRNDWGYTTPASTKEAITSFVSANIDLNDYLLGFEDNGRAEYVKLTTSSTGNIGNVASAGTFSNSAVTVAQYKNERVMIGDPSKGLFTWDGANLVSIGSVGTIASTNAGSGYTSAPSVTISTPNDANGVQATAVATITTGAGGVQSIRVSNIGSGYT